MTDTAKQTPEAPLTWTSKSEWGSVGNTHRASITLDNGDRWSFVVDQPRKGYWTARGWRADRDTTGSGDMVFYREDRTMKGAKAQVQAQANLAQTSTCDECRKISGHKLDCGTGLAADRERTKGQRIVLRDEGAEVIKSATGAMRQVGMAAALASHGLKKLACGLQGGVWNNIQRSAGCTCPTPTHRMSCGHGARPVVIRTKDFGGVA